MSLSIIDLENKMSLILQSYNDLGIDIKRLKEVFKACKTAKAYLRKHKNEPNNKKISKKREIVEATKESH